MSTTLEADPAAASTDAEPDIMALAMAADAGTLDHANLSTPAEPATAPQDHTSTPAVSGEEAKAQAEQQPAPKPATDKPAATEKPETPYQKAQKDTERRDKSWKALEAEKAQVRAEAQRIAATHAEIENLRRTVQELKTPAKPATDASGNTAEVYDQLAEKYAEEGDTKMAKLAREQASKLRTEAPARAPASAPAEVWKTPQFQSEWQRHTAELLASDPALNDPANPLVQTANMLTNHKEWSPYFRANPAGIKAALEVAKLMRAAASVDSLRKENETHKAEIDRLNKLTQPRRGGPTAPAAGEKSLAEMSDAEADAEIRRLAEAADRGGR